MGRLRVNGFEGTLQLRPARGLNMSLNGAYIDAELTDGGSADHGSPHGDTLPYTPKASFGFNADYEIGQYPRSVTHMLAQACASLADKRPASAGALPQQRDSRLCIAGPQSRRGLRAICT